MHKLMVGVRIDGQGEPDFFGWDEVNAYIRHGMRVVAVEPGAYFEGDLDNSEILSKVWYSAVLLDDYGIEPAEQSPTVDRPRE